MNLSKFEAELDHVLSGEDQTSELAELKQKLDAVSESEERTSQHQEWAWTRLSSQMTESSKRTPFGLWALMSSIALVGILAVNQFFFDESPQTEGDQVITLNVASPEDETKILADSAKTPKKSARVLRSNPHIYTTPFFSEDANAEVIWATGYDYLPSTYKVK